MRIGVEMIMEMRFMQRQGLKKTQIARRLGINRKTVARYLDDPERGRSSGERSSILDPYRAYIQYRLRQWPELSASRLYREISEPRRPENDPEGLIPPEPYQGSERTVRRYVARVHPRKKRQYRPVEIPGAPGCRRKGSSCTPLRYWKCITGSKGGVRWLSRLALTPWTLVRAA